METDVFIEDPDFNAEPTICNCSGFPRRHETSVFLAVKAAVTQEDTVFSFIKHVFLVFRQSSSAVVCRTLWTAIAVLLFVIGIRRFERCPYEQELPLFLVLEGVAIILKSCLNVIIACQRRKQNENERNALETFNDILTLFVILWTLTGTVWTFGILNYMDEVPVVETKYCDKLVFTCALVYLVIVYSCIFAIVIIVNVLILFYCYKNDHSDSQLPYEIHVQR